MVRLKRRKATSNGSFSLTRMVVMSGGLMSDESAHYSQQKAASLLS
jgi:hypothetical protein